MHPAIKKISASYLIATILFTSLILAPRPAEAQSGGKGPLVEGVCTLFGGTMVLGGGAILGTLGNTLGSFLNSSVPTYETNPALVNISAQQATETCSSIVGGLVGTLIEILRKRLLDMMVDQIIFWVQGGGEPQFVSDWSGFLQDAADQAIGDFTKEIGLGFLCYPFGGPIAIALAPIKKFSQRASCTLTQIVGNIENFYADFTNGGWIAYTTSLQPQNNYFGALGLALEEKYRRIADAQRAAENEAISGGGFLSTLDCFEAQGPIPEGEDPSSYFGPDLDGDGAGGDYDCQITTPGRTVGDLVSKAIGSNIDYIIQADELAEYVTAISDAVINRLIIEGVNGLKGLSSNNKPSGGFIAPGLGACAGLPPSAYETCLNYSSGNYIQLGQAPFEIAKAEATSTIQASLLPRKDAETAYINSLGILNTHLINLQNLNASFNALVCGNKPAYLAALGAEFAWATPTATNIQNQLTLNAAVVSQLENAESEINAFATENWGGLTAILDGLQTSGALDAFQAEAIKASAIADNGVVQNHAVAALTALNTNLTSCQAGI